MTCVKTELLQTSLFAPAMSHGQKPAGKTSLRHQPFVQNFGSADEVHCSDCGAQLEHLCQSAPAFRLQAEHSTNEAIHGVFWEQASEELFAPQTWEKHPK